MAQNILTKANTRLFNRYFILVWLVSLTVTMGQSMMNSTSALYIDHLGYPETLSGLANLFFSVMAVLARLLGGYICDKKSRRLVMICACAIFSRSTARISDNPRAMSSGSSSYMAISAGLMYTV